MHAKITKHMLEKLTKMVPKWSQASPKSILEGSGGHLGATLEARCFQDLTFDDFGSNLGPPLGPVWAHFGHQFCWCFFEVAFWWPWPPFGLPKHLQNETQKGAKTKTWISSILLLFTIHEPHSRVQKIIIFRCFFGTPFWDGFGSPFWWFWLAFGVPFGNHFGHFLSAIFCIDF